MTTVRSCFFPLNRVEKIFFSASNGGYHFYEGAPLDLTTGNKSCFAHGIWSLTGVSMEPTGNMTDGLSLKANHGRLNSATFYLNVSRGNVEGVQFTYLLTLFTFS